MKGRLQTALEHVMPFLIIGVAVALFIGLFIMLSYVVVWGLFIGAILWLIFWLKDFFTVKSKTPKSKGRVIEHDDK